MKGGAIDARDPLILNQHDADRKPGNLARKGTDGGYGGAIDASSRCHTYQLYVDRQHSLEKWWGDLQLRASQLQEHNCVR